MATVKKICIGSFAITEEDKFAKNIAKHVVKARQEAPIDTTGELSGSGEKAIPMKIRAVGGTSCGTYLSGNPH